MWEMFFNLSYFAAHKGKTLFVCRVYKSRYDPFMGVCGIPHNLFSNYSSCSSIIQLFFIKVLRCKSDVIQQDKKSKRNTVCGHLWRSRVKAFLCHPFSFPKEKSWIIFKKLIRTLKHWERGITEESAQMAFEFSTFSGKFDLSPKKNYVW